MQEHQSKRLDWTWDETILALDLYFECNGPDLGSVGEAHPAVIELSEFLRSLPIHDERDRKENFRNPGSVSMKLQNFLRWDPSHTNKGLSGLSNGSRTEGEVWDSFASKQAYLASVAGAIRENFKNPGDQPSDFNDLEEITATEGSLLIRVHNQRERSPKLVKRKKPDAIN